MSNLTQINLQWPDYNDGRGPLKNALMHHEQVYTSRGFTCDKGIHCIIEALWKAGFTTIGSCEADRGWYVPRGEVTFTHSDPHVLLNFCLLMQEKIIDDDGGWAQEIKIGRFRSKIAATVSFTAKIQSKFLSAISSTVL